MRPSILDKVKIFEAGAHYIVSGKDETIVNYVMAQLEQDGATGVSKAARVGDNWIASFEHPLLRECKVETYGYKSIVLGPTRDIVMLYSDQFLERGAQIEAGPMEVGDHWELYLMDEAARTGTSHF